MLQTASDKFLLRTPLFPFQFAENIFNNNLKELVNDRAFMFGLYLSSKDLYEEFRKQAAAGEISTKMAHTLQKYWLRASTRSTPYASFAGCTIGETGTDTNIELHHYNEHKDCLRLDMNLVYKILSIIHNDVVIKDELLYFTNNSLYALGGKYRYVRYNIKNNERAYFLTELEVADHINDIILRCAGGTNIYELISVLNEYGVSDEDAKEFLYEMIAKQVIISELEPNVSGEDPFVNISEKLIKYTGAAKYVNLINYISAQLNTQHYNIEELKALIDYLQSNGIDSLSVTTPFQCDLNIKTINNRISKKTIECILTQVSEVLSVTYKQNENERLEEFKKKFITRYEGQEVSLFEAMDVEFGIGYGSYSSNLNPFISDVNFSGAEDANTAHNVFQQKANETSTINFEPIHFKRSDLNIKPKQAIKLPNFNLQQNLYLWGSLYGKDGKSIDEGNFQFFASALTGPSFANIIARFGNINADMQKWVKSLTASEAESLPPDTVYAELIHLPQERIGNISFRPVLRAFEIPYLGNSGADKSCQIPVSDITIKIEAGDIILRSKKLNKRIIPRITNAHNFFHKALPLYNFIGDLQNQKSFMSTMWDGIVTSNSFFTPRVTYENIILKKAKWQINKDDLKGISKNENEMRDFFLNLRKEKKLPQRVLLQQSDNELLIDFSYIDSILILLSYIEKQDKVQLVELLSDSENSFIKSEAGNYVNEVVIPVKIIKEPAHPSTSVSLVSTNIKRVFMPGDEWLYLKVYCSINTAEEIVMTVLQKTVSKLLNKGLISQFFFIRYADPDFHLRIRFKLGDKSSFTQVNDIFKKALNQFLQYGSVTKIQIDTYVRELERYGSKTMGESESIFHNDSIAVIDSLAEMHASGEERLKWVLALLGTDAYLNDFDYGIDKKIEFAAAQQKLFYNEFGGGLPLQRSLNEKFRNLKNEIFEVFESPDKFKNYRSIYASRSEKNKDEISRIKKINKNQPGATDYLLPSYIHMFIDRLFASENRKHELTIYHLLLKYYTSLKAKSGAAI